ncbi:MAG: DUF2225 domain-containing protein [Bacillota bacterium]|nr:DUF2225 domain-containing protein [Bacillota bacterium]
MHPALYQQMKICPACGRRFTVTRPRLSACTALKRETDFRVQYAGLDPTLYSVWVCPRCGYSASETTFERLEEAERQRVQEALSGRLIPEGTEGERTPAGAIAAYKQAIFLGQVRRLSASNLAGLHLKLAWIYRGLNDQAAEREHLAAARDLYQQAYNRERLGGEGKMSEATVAYLVGELSRRLGEYATAVTWFSRLAMDPRTKREPQILSLAREQWHTARRQAAGEAVEEAASPAQPDHPQTQTGPTTPAPAPAEVEASAASEAPASETPASAKPVARAPAARAKESKISSMVPLYRDQVEWLRKVVATSDHAGGKLMLADVIRAVLDVVVLTVPPERLGARHEEELRLRLASLFPGPADE